MVFAFGKTCRLTYDEATAKRDKRHYGKVKNKPFKLYQPKKKWGFVKLTDLKK